MTNEYHTQLLQSRFAQAALSVKGLTQPKLLELANYLFAMEALRGKPMSADHLKQEAAKWAKR